MTTLTRPATTVRPADDHRPPGTRLWLQIAWTSSRDEAWAFLRLMDPVKAARAALVPGCRLPRTQREYARHGAWTWRESGFRAYLPAEAPR